MVEVKVPEVGESITEVQVGKWLKSEGDFVAAGEDLVEIETEKASVQIPSPAAGILRGIRVAEEAFASVGDVIAQIEPAAQGAPTSAAATPAAPMRSAAPAQEAAAVESPRGGGVSGHVMPAAARMMADSGLAAGQVRGTGPGGRILKEDVVTTVKASQAAAGQGSQRSPGTSSIAAPSVPGSPATSVSGSASLVTSAGPQRGEEIKAMSMIRRTIAARLVEAQQTAALLTTFNEVDMSPVMEMRKKYRDLFAEKHGVKLGFMSFFAKAAVEALRRFPAVNAEIRGNNIVYRHYYDIGIAIGGGKGLVVPVLRNVESMSFAEIERSIGEYGRAASENRISPQDLEGGTFTISNGGVYGSLLSTPIVNPPQSGILGLHAIQDRPVAVDGQVVIRPMMYLALTYDHRIVDGREAVTFLRTIKEVIEDPARLFLEV